jgi:hypothetical protein
LRGVQVDAVARVDGLLRSAAEAVSMADQAPEEASRQACVQTVESHRQHPAIERWFHAVTTFEVPIPGLGVFRFPAIELRDGRLGAVLWSDGPDCWGTGGWHPLTPEATFPLDLSGTRPVVHGLTFVQVLDALVVLRQEVSVSRRPWWRFW